MKLTTRLKRGRKTEWWVLEGGKVRTTVGEVNRTLHGGVEMKYCAYLHLLETNRDGEPYTLLYRGAADTLAEAVELVRAALESRDAVAEVSDRVTFIGVGMTQEKADQFAAGIRRRLPGS